MLSEATLQHIRESIADYEGPAKPGDATLQKLNLAAYLGERWARPMLTEIERLREGIKDIATGPLDPVWRKCKALLEDSAGLNLDSEAGDSAPT